MKTPEIPFGPHADIHAVPPSPIPSLDPRQPTTAPHGFDFKVEPWDEPVDGASLLSELQAVLDRFVILPKGASEVLALWILHTYAFDLRDISTYIGVESPEKRCGKSTLLAVLSELVNRPILSSNISSPAFFRVIEKLQPTLIIDEAATLLQNHDELRGIFNSGYSRKTAFVVRASNDKHARLLRFSSWCPKVIATIGRLPDTLSDRCIIIRMQRKLLTEHCERLRHLQGLDLRRKCARFVIDHKTDIENAHPEIPPDLNDRAADIWEPLFVLADIAGTDWVQKARDSALQITNDPQTSTPAGSLLLDLWTFYCLNDQDRFFTRDLVNRLLQQRNRPWMQCLRGRPVTDVWLAQQLKAFGVHPRIIRIGKEQLRGYVLADLKQPFKRYISKSDFRLQHATESLFQGDPITIPKAPPAPESEPAPSI